MERDLSQKQFDARIKLHGLRSLGFLEYYNFGISGHEIHVCALNAGTKKRNQLAYLLQEKDRLQKSFEKKKD